MNLRVVVDDSQMDQSYDADGEGPHSASFPSTSPSSPHRPSSVASLASVVLPLQVNIIETAGSLFVKIFIVWLSSKSSTVLYFKIKLMLINRPV